MADFAQGVKDLTSRVAAASITSGGNLVPVVYQGGTTKAPINSPWVRLTIHPSARNNVTAGDTPWVREYGLAIFDVFTQSGAGINSNFDIQKQLRTLLENKEFETVKSLEMQSRILSEQHIISYRMSLSFYVEGK